jgi:DNA helicase-2/ATP-dependent DNA helicase PcrA
MSEEEEAMFIVQTVLEVKLRGQRELRDIAVMYRTNAQSRSMEDAFVRAGVPYRLIGGTRFYDRKEVKDVLAYLRVIHNADDSLNLERIINVPARGIGKQTIGKLQAWAAERRQSMFDALQSLAHGEESPFAARTLKPLVEFAHLIERWREMRETKPAAYILNDVLEKTKYKSHLLADGTPEAIERAENVNELQAKAQLAGEMKLAEFLEEVALVSDVDSLDENTNSVVLLTLHSAKGLEFPVVFMIGLEDGILPHQMSMEDPEQMGEERRLMYVGVTRAKDVLYLSWSLTRAMYGRGDRMIPSRFLDDIPPSLTSGSHLPRRPKQAEYADIGPEFQTKWTLPKPPASTSYGSTTTASRPGNASPRPATERSGERGTTGYPSTRSAYKAGQKVLHPRFGEGVIIASKIRSGDEEIDIKFAGFGLKRLLASTANLVMIED